MDPVQSTAGKVVLDTVSDAAEQKSESSGLGGRILRACRPMCCSVQKDEDEKAEPDKQLQDRAGSESPTENGPVINVSNTSTIASQQTKASDSGQTTAAPTDTDASSSLPASEPSAGQRRASVDSGAGNLTGGTDS